MNAEAIQEIANQLGITVDAVTKEVIPAFAQFEIGQMPSELFCLDACLL